MHTATRTDGGLHLGLGSPAGTCQQLGLARLRLPQPLRLLLGRLLRLLLLPPPPQQGQLVQGRRALLYG